MNRNFFRTRVLLAAALVALVGGCVKLPRRVPPALDKSSTPTLCREGASQTCISINRATAEELARLPGIGSALAARIVEHRARYGAFRRPEQLIIVRGISERRYRQMRAFLAAE